jgi:hypothetical protein
MSVELSFLVVRDISNSIFSEAELNTLKTKILTYNNREFPLSNNPVRDCSFITIHPTKFLTSKELNDFSDSYFSEVPEDILNKIYDIAKYRTVPFLIDLKTGILYEQACAERWFGTSMAREMYSSLLENLLEKNLYNEIGYYEISGPELLNISNVFNYIKNGLRNNFWSLETERTLGCHDFVNSIGLSVYGYKDWENRNISNSVNGIAVADISKKKDKSFSLDSFIKHVKSLWEEAKEEQVDGNEDDDYEDDFVDSEEKFRYLSMIDEMSSMFEEMFRLKTTSFEPTCIKLLAAIG